MNLIFTAVSPQAFGFPMIVCHVNGKPEMFFGSDRFELMAHCIGEKPVLHIINKHKCMSCKCDRIKNNMTNALSVTHP